MRLFCIPYAGGSASIYLGWRVPLADIAEVIPIELAGRGRRLKDPYYNSFDETVQEVCKTILSQVGSEPYALFGHSMGCMIVYEVIHRLLAKGSSTPVVTFLSGRSAPHRRKERETPIHLLPDDEFRDVIMDLGGTPVTVFEHKEMYDISFLY
ncbi:thioesterase II family protein [Paenibacillus sp. MZ03-122A]|uniref:thioesterase II family protein n=1 Tax=Paenibacillus sp. MZ03-122A TaxID=2962033 RepID=UPI00349F89EE